MVPDPNDRGRNAGDCEFSRRSLQFGRKRRGRIERIDALRGVKPVVKAKGLDPGQSQIPESGAASKRLFGRHDSVVDVEPSIERGVESPRKRDTGRCKIPIRSACIRRPGSSQPVQQAHLELRRRGAGLFEPFEPAKRSREERDRARGRPGIGFRHVRSAQPILDAGAKPVVARLGR